MASLGASLCSQASQLCACCLGYTRAAVAAPILLMVPGSLMLGAVFSQRRRPRGLVFVSYSALLSAVSSAFVSLVLYAGGALVTAESTYWCLLAVSAVLAIVAEARLLLGPQEGVAEPLASWRRRIQTSLTLRLAKPRRKQPLGVRAITPLSRSWWG